MRNVPFLSPEQIGNSLDTLGLISRRSRVVMWPNMNSDRMTANHLFSHKEVTRLIELLYGERPKRHYINSTVGEVYRVLLEVGLIKESGRGQCGTLLVLPFALDENGNEVDDVQLLAEVLTQEVV